MSYSGRELKLHPFMCVCGVSFLAEMYLREHQAFCEYWAERKSVREDSDRKESGANASQVGGQHYKAKAIQPWTYIAANNLGYFEGNVVKYVSRWRDKGGVEDLRKAVHYLQKLIELETDPK